MRKKYEEILYLIWKNSQGKAFKVGRLRKIKNRFYFKYICENLEEMIEEEDFEMLPMFPKDNVEYFSEELFRTFMEMVPNRRFREEFEDEDAYSILKDNQKNLLDKSFFFVDDVGKDLA